MADRIVIQFTPQIDSVVLFAPNESITQVFASPPVPTTITPVIMQDGSPVTPDSLTITEDPSFGTAEVDGVNLIYTPNAGYVGPDAFHYLATVGGENTNDATVTAAVTLLALLPPIQKQHRQLAYLFDDNVMDCYARSDAGVLDMTGYALTAHVRPYSRPQPFGQDYGEGWPGVYAPYHTQFPATQLENGHIQFTIPAGTIRARMGSGLFRLHVTAQNPATLAETRVYTALLTIQ